MDHLSHVSFPLAFLAGLVSFLSPCVLPLVPAYLAFLGGRAGRAVTPGGAVVAPWSPGSSFFPFFTPVSLVASGRNMHEERDL